MFVDFVVNSIVLIRNYCVNRKPRRNVAIHHGDDQDIRGQPS